MKTRIISGFILFPIVFLTIFLGGTILKFALLFASLVALFELFKAIYGEHQNINYISFAFTLVFYLVFLNTNLPIDFLVIIYCMILFCYLVLKYPSINFHDVSIALFAVLYIPVLFSYVYRIREMENGIFYVWLVLISAFATDTFAYFTGVFLGKNKLIPHLSPNKTIEGSVGGIVGTILTSIIFALVYNACFDTSFNVLYVALVGFVCSIFAQFGDLTASSIKRVTEVKDFGDLIPGHGGILDRFDSILFTAPVLYILLLI